MDPDGGNLFHGTAPSGEAEQFTTLMQRPGVRVERIVSLGQASPPQGWYDQDEHEWVLVLRGRATLAYDDGSEVQLEPGSYVDIPAHTRHRVAWTTPDEATVWLAVFYR